MEQLLVFIRKEFFHIFRDRRTLLILFGLPVVQLLLFGFALSNEVKNIRLMIADNAGDVSSQELIAKIRASRYFILEEQLADYSEIEQKLKAGAIKGALIFPAGFGNDLSGAVQLQLIADGSDPNIAKTMFNYLNSILADYRQSKTTSLPDYRIEPEIRLLYNEEGSGSLGFIPGLMALILMIVCTALTSVAVVKEKETGTMEVLLVSPFKPAYVLLAKAIPYLLLSLLNFTLIVAMALLVLNVEVKGSLFLLFATSTLFIITCLSFGLLISNVTSSQQTALLISLMGMMLPTLIFTGFLLPIENMPGILQLISNLVPSRWYYLITKAIMLKGLGIAYIWKETLVLSGMTVFLLGLAIKKFSIRLQ